VTTAADLTDYYVIHRALRIAPRRMAAAAGSLTPGDQTRATALGRYWHGYAGEVLVHHTVEDDVFFPKLAERVAVPADHLARVEVDHHHLDDLMGRCRTALDRLAATPAPPEAAEAGAVLLELADHMDEHLAFEDSDLLPLFERHFTADEYKALHDAAVKLVGFGKQAAFTVPFVLHWATPAEQQALIGDAPLPFRLLWRATRRSHARLASRALGAAAVPQAVTR
jgi:hemerythrin-like domain-containing protein